MEGNKLNVGEEWFKNITQITLNYRRKSDLSIALKNKESLTADAESQKLDQYSANNLANKTESITKQKSRLS